jgi:hypothetical protein
MGVLFRFASRPKPHFPSPDELGFAELRGGGSRVVIIPALGGKIVSLVLGGRDWLWTSDVLPWTRVEPDDPATGRIHAPSYADIGDTGGYDECFPTVGACRLPTWIKGVGSLELPDHGELWSSEPETRVRTSAEGQSVTCTWNGRRLPYKFARDVSVSPKGEVVLRYGVTNEGRERLPFLWSAQTRLPLSPETRIVLPPDTRIRIYAQHEMRIQDLGGEHRWPMLRVDGRLADLSRPDSVGKRYACKLFADGQGGRAGIEEGDSRLEVLFDPSEVPTVGVWINKGGWWPFRRTKGRYMNLGLEPSVGAPERLDEALGKWNEAHWLEPGETKRWTLLWRAKRVEPTAGSS